MQRSGTGRTATALRLCNYRTAGSCTQAWKHNSAREVELQTSDAVEVDLGNLPTARHPG